MRRFRIGVTAVAMLATALTLPASRLSAVDPPTGRVILIQPQRVVDTRVGLGWPSKLLPTVPFTMPSGLVNFVVLDAVADGRVDLYPCSGAPSGDPTILMKTGVPHARSAVIDAGTPTCLVASAAVDLVVDVWGQVSTPSIGGLQYHSLATPTEIHDSTPTAGATTRVGRGSTPAGARGGTFLIEAIDGVDAGYLIAHGCDNVRPDTFTLLLTGGRTSTITNIDLGSGELCIFQSASTRIRVTQLGYLSTDGSNVSALPPSLTSAQAQVIPPGLRPVTPERVLNTRETTKLVAGKVRELSLVGKVTRETTAVTMNVTVTGPEADGYLTVYPCDQDRPNASNLNFAKDQDVPNLVTVKLGTLKNVCLYSTATTHVLADLAGTYEAEGGSVSSALTPLRILDTRIASGVATAAKLEPNVPITLQVAGAGGGQVPSSGVTAVTMNVTAAGPEGQGYLTVWPCGQAQPDASNLNFVPNVDVPNLVTVKLSASGTVCIVSTARTHVLADAAMWYSDDASAGFVDLAPDRLLDTRTGVGAGGATTPMQGNAATPLTLQVAGRLGVPATGAVAVTMNVTAAGPQGDGYVTVWPCDQPQPNASNLNFRSGHDVPNLVVVKLSATGTVCFASTATTHLLADVAGYSTAQTTAAWTVAVR